MSSAPTELFKPTSDRSAKGRAARRRGAERERAVRNMYRERGWQAFKVSDSSAVDVVAFNPLWRETLFIEVKSDPKPYDNFPPAERKALSDAAKQAGATPLLFHWPKGVGIERARQISEDVWP